MLRMPRNHQSCLCECGSVGQYGNFYFVNGFWFNSCNCVKVPRKKKKLRHQIDNFYFELLVQAHLMTL